VSSAGIEAKSSAQRLGEMDHQLERQRFKAERSSSRQLFSVGAHVVKRQELSANANPFEFKPLESQHCDEFY
jgi:hypothetical protein